MAEEVVKDVKTDSGLGSLACMLKVALLAPKLLRDFRPKAAPPSDSVPGADGVRDDNGHDGSRPGVVFNGPVTITGSAVAIGAQGNMLSLDSHDGDSNVRNGGSGRRPSLNVSDDSRWDAGDSRDAPAPVDDSADRAEDESGWYDVSQLKDRGMPGESAAPEADDPAGAKLPGSKDVPPVLLTGYMPLAEDTAPKGLNVREEGRYGIPAEARGPGRPGVAAGLAVPEGLQLRRVPDTAPERQAAVLGDVELVRSHSNDDAVVLRRRSLGEAPVFAPVVLPELAARLKPVTGETDRPALSFGGLPQNVTLRHWGERPSERRPRPVSWSGDYGLGRRVELTWNRETQSKAVPEYKHYFRDPALTGQSVPRSGARAENRAGTENRQSAAAVQDIRRQARRSSGGGERA
jgi:hypothetical protein